jgi:FkbM family methyltransferase
MTRRPVDRGHDLLRAVGVDIIRFQPSSHPLARRASLFKAYGVDLVIDVGANDGGYALEIRRLGYKGRIVSFEPLPEAKIRLDEARRGDDRWEAMGVALGDEPGEAVLHVAGNSASSSILPMLPEHERFAPESANVGAVAVEVRRLDDLADEVIRDARRPLLKVDAQGFEERVLDGARLALGRFVGVQVELSIIPLYDGAPASTQLVDRLAVDGFTLMSIEPGFSDPATGRLLQYDGLFFRADRLEPPR